MTRGTGRVRRLPSAFSPLVLEGAGCAKPRATPAPSGPSAHAARTAPKDITRQRSRYPASSVACGASSCTRSIGRATVRTESTDAPGSRLRRRSSSRRPPPWTRSAGDIGSKPRSRTNGVVMDGTLSGDLFVVGSGDPSIGGRGGDDLTGWIDALKRSRDSPDRRSHHWRRRSPGGAPARARLGMGRPRLPDRCALRRAESRREPNAGDGDAWHRQVSRHDIGIRPDGGDPLVVRSGRTGRWVDTADLARAASWRAAPDDCRLHPARGASRRA